MRATRTQVTICGRAAIRLARAAGLALGAATVSMSACASFSLHQRGPDEAEVVHVVLTDDSLDISPHTIEAGKVILDIEDGAQLEHSVRVEGPGTDEQSEELAYAGQRQRLPLKLEAGTFHLYCPDGNHATRGISARLVVTPRASNR
jgi:hypothetical protein